ncbi:hypothetical protein L6452_03591 [Arctium lappa]|uniref:Uncharacterized protein n=1 Tax=Arctium lappa TaxID=4217 RepID=A0ACB9FNN3_ARCLA|nr:hypothetical protein L6452_03591 [Arctium lappa]
MVVAFLVAVVLDNTMTGSRQERGVYVWSEPEVAQREPVVAKDYGLPFRVMLVKSRTLCRVQSAEFCIARVLCGLVVSLR